MTMVRQFELVERPLHVATIASQDDIGAVRLDPCRLVSRRMPGGREDQDRPVAVDIVLTRHRDEGLARVELFQAIELPVSHLLRKIHFALLDNYAGIREVGISACVVCMKMRSYDPADIRGIHT